MKRKASKSLKRGNTKKQRVIRPFVPKKVDMSTLKNQPKKNFESWNTGTALTAPTNATGGEITSTIPLEGNVGALIGVTSVTTGEDGRDSDEIRIVSINVRGTITCAAQANQTNADLGTKVMIAIVLDKQPNGATMNSEDCYTNPSSTSSLAASPFRDLDYSKRFQVLKTLDMTLTNPSITYDGTNIEQSGLIHPFDIYLNTDIVQQYTTTSGLIAAQSTNALHMIAYTSSTALAPTIQYNCRIRFYDSN